MPLIIPNYSLNDAPNTYVDRPFANVFVWFTSGSQQLERAPYGMTVSGHYYESQENFTAKYSPLDVFTYVFSDQNDIAALIYGTLDPAWTIPSGINPLTGLTAPFSGLKLETAYLVRNHPILGQSGAVWS